MTLSLLPADIVCTRGSGWLSRAIRFCTRVIGESRTQVNHVGVIVTAGTPAEAMIVEAVSGVVLRPLWPTYAASTGNEIAVFRSLRLTDEERSLIASAAREYIGRHYGYLKLVAHLADWCLCGAYVFRRLTNMDRYPICSWLVAHAYGRVGESFGVAPGAATPDDIWDFCVAHPERYGIVMALGPLTKNGHCAERSAP